MDFKRTLSRRSLTSALWVAAALVCAGASPKVYARSAPDVRGVWDGTIDSPSTGERHFQITIGEQERSGNFYGVGSVEDENGQDQSGRLSGKVKPSSKFSGTLKVGSLKVKFKLKPDSTNHATGTFDVFQGRNNVGSGTVDVTRIGVPG